MITLLCSLALAADLPLPDAPAATRRHTAIVVMHTGEFAIASGLATGLVGVIAWRNGPCYGDAGVCSLGIAGGVTTLVGLTGAGVGVPIWLGGAMLKLDPGNPAGSVPDEDDRWRDSVSVRVGIAPNGLVLSGNF